VFLGVFFIWKSQKGDTPENTTTTNPVKEVTNTKKEDPIKKVDVIKKITDDAKKVTEVPIVKDPKNEETTILTPPKKEPTPPTTVVRPINPPIKKITKPVEKDTAEVLPTIPSDGTKVKVYLYEWNIDMSQKNIPVGNIIFEVQNNGRFTHDFTVSNIKDFGKIRPGETRVFSAKVKAGDYEIYSERGKDEEYGMNEEFSVVR